MSSTINRSIPDLVEALGRNFHQKSKIEEFGGALGDPASAFRAGNPSKSDEANC